MTRSTSSKTFTVKSSGILDFDLFTPTPQVDVELYLFAPRNPKAVEPEPCHEEDFWTEWLRLYYEGGVTDEDFWEAWDAEVDQLIYTRKLDMCEAVLKSIEKDSLTLDLLMKTQRPKKQPKQTCIPYSAIQAQFIRLALICPSYRIWS